MLKLFRSDASNGWTDEALLEAYATGGDMRHLGILYERYMPMVYGVCMKVLSDPAQAEDAVMGVFETLVVKAREHEVESFRGWLYVMARNYCLMEWRKQKRMPTELQAPEQMQAYDAPEPAFESEMPGEADNKALVYCLETLPELQKRSVQMFYYEDKSYKDISDIMSEDIGRVRSYIQNGRRNLKICIEKQAGLRQ